MGGSGVWCIINITVKKVESTWCLLARNVKDSKWKADLMCYGLMKGSYILDL